MFLFKTPEELATLFEDGLLDTNRGFNYYIDWTNIDGYQRFAIELHAMDALIGCDDAKFDRVFYELLKKLPTAAAVFPYLFALAKAERKALWSGREKLKIIGETLGGDDFMEYGFCIDRIAHGFDDDEIACFYNFFKQMGLKKLFQSLLEKSVTDYIIGVLAGMDSNGRKNRGGQAFELACEPVITEIASKYSARVFAQKKFSILRKYGFDISEDIANRKADFILLNAQRKLCMNIEVNFYNGSGSKPEKIIDSYINRQSELLTNGIRFALITDGNCWRGTTNQLTKGLRHLDYLMNFSLAKHGMLEEVVRDIFQ